MNLHVYFTDDDIFAIIMELLSPSTSFLSSSSLETPSTDF